MSRERSKHIVKIPGGSKPLSVLASPVESRTPASYRLSDEDRQILEAVLAGDLSAS